MRLLKSYDRKPRGAVISVPFHLGKELIRDEIAEYANLPAKPTPQQQRKEIAAAQTPAEDAEPKPTEPTGN